MHPTAPKSIAQRTLGSMFWVFLSQGAEAILYLAVLAILARLLTPADFGVVAAAMMVIHFGKIFSQYGVGSTVVQRPQLGPLQLRGIFTIAWVSHLLLALGLLLAAPGIAAFFRLEPLAAILRWLALLFALQGISVVAESRLQRNMQFRMLAAVDVITFAVGYGLLGILLALRGFGAWALVGGLLAQTFLKTVALLLLAPHPMKPTLHGATMRELLFYTGGFSAGHLASYFAHQSDKFVVGHWLGAEALGIYTRAYEMMAAPSKFLGGIFDKALFPAMAAIQADSAELARAYRRGVAVIALVVLPTSPILIILAPEVVQVVLGDQWSAAVLPFQILTVGALLRMEYRMSDSLVRASGTVVERAWRQILYVLAVVVGAWVGQRGGLPGVAYGVLAAITLHFSLMVGLCLRLSTVSWLAFVQAHGPAVRVTMVVGAPVWLVVTLLRTWGVHPILVVGAAGIVVGAMGIALLWFASERLLGPDGIWILKTLLERIPDRFNPFVRLRREPQMGR